MQAARRKRHHPTIQPAYASWCRTIHGSATADLSAGIAPPTLDAAVYQRAGVIVASSNHCHATRQPDDIDWCEPRSRRTIAKLPIAIVAPALHPTLARYCTGVIKTCCKGCGPAAQSNHSDRRERVGRRTVAKLTEAILAPAFDATAIHERATMPATRGNSRHP